MSALRWAAFVLVAALTFACHKSEAPTPAPAPQAPAAQGADAKSVADAISNPHRLGGDLQEDEWRKPADVLSFLEVRPGQRIVDYFSAGGYFTELLATAVGPQGQVIAYNNAPYLKFAGEVPLIRYGSDRLPNVVQLTTPPEQAPFEPASIDAVLFVMSYHDLYWRPKDPQGWPSTDPAQALAKLVPAMKPGAIAVVVDHVANAGSDPLVSVDALHRIDPAVVKRDFEAAGLVFDAESNALRHPEDDHTRQVFDDSVKHKTDRIMYRFRKP